eukprot:CAMPEP_0204832300 /NCGR_PEP_ID=MMETSP1346-20131115/13122_1 /ASSEMBLY_ACC=CAM_ASM_000771 /TAXON_ID=215587 /ORGANISM="Aplanochytrium stocchinoi, Strain GSBS06" /LENGTH=224 /DNA_ID=CAMNT_0051964001 /DNA_START=443 /DNA_END=1117 /DNA_ORIENTATION=+
MSTLSGGSGIPLPQRESKDKEIDNSGEPPRKQPKLAPTETLTPTTTQNRLASAAKIGSNSGPALATGTKATSTTTTSDGPGTNVKEVSASLQRLLRSGFTESEISVSRERLNKLLKEVEPRARLSPEVEEILLQLSLRFVQSTTEFASHLATHRGSDELNVADLRLYVEKILGMKIPGFGSTPCGRGSASAYTYAKATGRPGEVPDAHQKRLNLIKQTSKKSNT